MIDPIQSFDYAVTMALNNGAREVPVVDQIIAWVTFHDVLRGGITVALLWGAWFHGGYRFSLRDSKAIETVLAAGIALAVARAMQLLLPHYPRPLHNPDLAFTPPYGVDAETLTGWSSFPSDHAVLFFALATATYLIGRPFGIASFLWAAFVVSIPRIYIGAHYPSDIISGAVIGVLIVLICFRAFSLLSLNGLRAYAEARPYLAMPILFLITFEFAHIFDHVRGAVALLVGIKL